MIPIDPPHDETPVPGVLYKALTAPAGYTAYYTVDYDGRLAFQTTMLTVLVTRDVYARIEAMAATLAPPPQIALVR